MSWDILKIFVATFDNSICNYIIFFTELQPFCEYSRFVPFFRKKHSRCFNCFEPNHGIRSYRNRNRAANIFSTHTVSEIDRSCEKTDISKNIPAVLDCFAGIFVFWSVIRCLPKYLRNFCRNFRQSRNPSAAQAFCFSRRNAEILFFKTEPQGSGGGIVNLCHVQWKNQFSETFHIVVHFDVGGVPNVIAPAYCFCKILYQLPIPVPLKFVTVSPKVE